MILSDYLRVDYAENDRSGRGPIAPGAGRGHWFDNETWFLSEFLTDQGLSLLRTKAKFLLEQAGIRKDFAMRQSGGTPRHMRVVPGTVINQDPTIVEMYRHPDLLEFLSEIVRKQVIVYDDPLENIVITSLEKTGDTHGAHLDVPPLALVMCLEAPYDPDKHFDVVTPKGETWETIRGSDDGAGAVSYIDAYGDPNLISMAPGDAYIMRTDLWKHEVLPLTKPEINRTILNFTYSFEGFVGTQDGSATALFTC